MDTSKQVEEMHWRDRSIAKSEAISDAWEVVKAYAARVAEWVLFLCLLSNILEMLPLGIPNWFGNIVIAIQVITLDVAGFGLTTMADHARRLGNEKAASTGKRMGWALISLMIVTVVLVTVAILIPSLKPYTDGAEKVLILARIVVTVLYGHVVHSLRHASITHTNEVSSLKKEVSGLRQEVSTLQQIKEEQVQAIADLRSHLNQARIDLQLAQQGENGQAQSIRQLRDQIAQLETTNASLLNGADGQGSIIHNLQTQLSQTQQQIQNSTATLEQRRRDFERVNADLQTANLQITELQNAHRQTAKIQQDHQNLASTLQAANLQIADLTAKLERAKNKITELQNAGESRTTKSTKITQIDQAREKRDKAKVSHEEVLAYMEDHPELKRAEVAAKLGISERKVYDAISWGKGQENAEAVAD